MPSNQTAQVPHFDFGAPVLPAPVLTFAVRRGGKVVLTFLNDAGMSPVTASVKVSPDGASYIATTDDDNTNAVTNIVVKPRCSSTIEMNLRPGVDMFMQVEASGGVRAAMQVRGGESAGLEPRQF